MKNFIFITMLLLSTLLSAKTPDTKKVLEEGKLLYRLEKANWYGSDFLMSQYPDKMDIIGGYVSYVSERNQITTTYYNRKNRDKIEIRLIFDSLPKQNPVFIDSLHPSANSLEKELIYLRQDAINRITANTDQFFSFYKDCSFNIIPLITPKERKTIILTGTSKKNVLILGNDYKLTYNQKNKFSKKEKIHMSLIQLPLKSESDTAKILSTVHSHVLDDIISSTDICTMLLYKDYIDWDTHYVIGKNWVSIFDLRKESLFILSRKIWDMKFENEK